MDDSAPLAAIGSEYQTNSPRSSAILAEEEKKEDSVTLTEEDDEVWSAFQTAPAFVPPVVVAAPPRPAFVGLELRNSPSAPGFLPPATPSFGGARRVTFAPAPVAPAVPFRPEGDDDYDSGAEVAPARHPLDVLAGAPVLAPLRPAAPRQTLAERLAALPAPLRHHVEDLLPLWGEEEMLRSRRALPRDGFTPFQRWRV